MSQTAETLEYDVVIVGFGPAGAACSIRLKQLAQAQGKDLSILVVEKGSDCGAHKLSGAVLEPSSLNDLLPNWQSLEPPHMTPVTQDRFYMLSKKRAWRLPTPTPMKNHGNYIISLAHISRWLAQYAESQGIDILSGFAAKEVIYNDQNQVIGIQTGDFGIQKDGPGPNFQQGMAIYAKQVILAEGCRGSTTETVMSHYKLRQHCMPQSYGIGLKEIWEVPDQQFKPGLAIHTIGWPLDHKTYGGSFVYHWTDNKVAVGYVIGLDYSNTYLNPYEEFQRFKHHPFMAKQLKGGRRTLYGSRALNEGGFQSIPQLHFPGGLIVGCGAGFLNTPKIKGIHGAMRSGMLAAEALMEDLSWQSKPISCERYQHKWKQSSLYHELWQVRNIRPGFRWGLWPGLVYAGIDTYILRGYAPWTLGYKPDHEHLKTFQTSTPINYPKHDGSLSFDLLDSVRLSNTNHNHDQPSHLILKQPDLAISVNWEKYRSPETRYCPANVYEINQQEDGSKKLVINAQNCVHCKTCDIKDITQNIQWVPPEGGQGPNYADG